MDKLKFHMHTVFRETENVVFYDISIPQCNASDLVIHESAATSPPNDSNGNKQFYIHHHQIDNNRVIEDNFLDYIENTQSESDYNNLYITKYDEYEIDINQEFLYQ